MLQHGTPGNRWHLVFDEDEALRRSLRFVSVDRPGYGQSTFHPDRTLRSWALDVGELADALALERFAVFGHSGGGPNALSCAAELGDRVTMVVLVASVAPPAQADPPGMVRRLVERVRDEGKVVLARSAPDVALGMARRRLPPPDVAVISKPEWRTRFVEEFASAPRSTARSVTLDRRIGRSRWGFDLGRVSQPVHLFHGREDRSVPPRAAEVLDGLLPSSELHLLEGAGHLFVYERFFDLIDTACQSETDTAAQPPSA